MKPVFRVHTSPFLNCKSYFRSPLLGMMLLISVFVAVGTDLSVLEQEIDKRQRELKATRQQLEETRLRLQELQKSEKVSLERLETYQEQVRLLQSYLRRLDAQLAARTEEITQVARISEQTAAEIALRQKRLSERLLTLYKYGLLMRLQAVMSAEDVTELFRRFIRLRWLARADRKLAEELKQLLIRQSQERERLRAAKAELEILRNERLREEEALVASKQAESLLLSRVRSEKKAQEELEQELEDAQRQLQKLIAELEKQRQTESGSVNYLEQNKGKLRWPVRGKVITSFGSQVHPQYKTRTNSTGIDIETKPGEPVVATGPGKVVYADQFMGYGRLVIIDHGNGYYTLYGNLDSMVPVGTYLSAGSTLGRTKNYLHYEIRKQGQPVDPLEWLEP